MTVIQSDKKNKNNFASNIMLFIIFLSILQIFFQDFCLFSKFPFAIYEKICLSTVIFDSIFTIEFFIKLIYSAARHQFVHYFKCNDGWVDFFVSIPMLALISSPLVIIWLHVNNVITSDNNIYLRIAMKLHSLTCLQTYKFFRILKINGKMNLPTSPMVSHHIGKIIKTVLSTIISCLCILNLLQDFNLVPSRYSTLERNEQNIATSLLKQEELAPRQFENVAGISVTAFKDVCGLIYNNKWVYKSNQVDFANLSRQMFFLDKLYNYYVGANNCVYVIFSRQTFYETVAFNNMLKLILMLFLIITIIISYTPHLILYVSQPLLAMNAAMCQTWNVSKIYIEKHYKDEEVYQLAQEFNARWLPAKVRALNKYKSRLLMTKTSRSKSVKRMQNECKTIDSCDF